MEGRDSVCPRPFFFLFSLSLSPPPSILINFWLVKLEMFATAVPGIIVQIIRIFSASSPQLPEDITKYPECIGNSTVVSIGLQNAHAAFCLAALAASPQFSGLFVLIQVHPSGSSQGLLQDFEAHRRYDTCIDT